MNKKSECKIFNIFLPIILNMNHLIETVLLSTHQHMFRLGNKKIIFWYALITRGLLYTFDSCLLELNPLYSGNP